MARVLTDQVRAFFEPFGVPAPTDWQYLDKGQTPPNDPNRRVSMKEAAQQVALHRKEHCPSDGMLPPKQLEAPPRRAATLDDRYAYQNNALHKIIDDQNRAHSGVVVAPCGAGKTNIGLLAAQSIRGPTLVVCSTAEAAKQWRDKFLHVVVAGAVRILGDKSPVAWDAPTVTVTTYQYLSDKARQQVGVLPQEALCALYVWKYALVIFDEVWKLPAYTYQQACALLQTDVRLGLTADLRRSDGKEDFIFNFVGPILYEMTREEGVAGGVVASVRHKVTVLSPTQRFLDIYRAETSENDKKLLTALYPPKVKRLCELLRETTALKVLVFCDKIRAIRLLADVLKQQADDGLPFLGTLSGEVSKTQRANVCETIRRERKGVALLSKVGDDSLNFPDVDLIVETSLVDGAAQPKVQRDGRAQRVCEGKSGAEVVYLVVDQTHEMEFARKRIHQTNSDAHTSWSKEEAAPSGSTGAPVSLWSEEELYEIVSNWRTEATGGKRKTNAADATDPSAKKRQRLP